jgi:cation diffusion facilitator family transporter
VSGKHDHEARGTGHGHGHGGGHDHAAVDRDLYTHQRAVRAIWISAIGLGSTALFQFAVVAFSGSVGLFADALHNIGDVAGTASLWIAFSLSRRAASDEFPYGWRRAEDLAGLLILLAIAVSAILAGWDAVSALLGGGHEIRNLGAAFGAALVGILGNEGVAQYKIRVGRQIDSVPLIADGQHARTDGLASAAAAVGIAGAWLGFPLADPLAGLAITVGIGWILFDVGRDVLRRNMDAVDPDLLPKVREIVAACAGVHGVHDVRARYVGRSLYLQLHVEADGDLPLRDAHAIAEDIRHTLVHEIPAVVDVDVHLDPAGEDEDAHAETHHHFSPG